jgi:hypothetical protein
LPPTASNVPEGSKRRSTAAPDGRGSAVSRRPRRASHKESEPSACDQDEPVGVRRQRGVRRPRRGGWDDHRLGAGPERKDRRPVAVGDQRRAVVAEADAGGAGHGQLGDALAQLQVPEVDRAGPGHRQRRAVGADRGRGHAGERRAQDLPTGAAGPVDLGGAAIVDGDDAIAAGEPGGAVATLVGRQ